MNPDLRIGDVERDDAARLLQEHLTAGRLDHEEFSSRMAGALGATHQSQLDGLFLDLPGRRPGAVAPTQQTPLPDVPTHRRRWNPWLVGPAAAVLVSMLATTPMMMAEREPMGGGMRHHGRPGHAMAPDQLAPHAHAPWFPMMVVIVTLAVVALVVVRRARQERPAMAAAASEATGTLTSQQRAAIDAAVRGGHRVRAIKLFREATGANLATAAAAISAWERRWKASRG